MEATPSFSHQGVAMEMASPISKLRLGDTMSAPDGSMLVEVETSDTSIPIIDLGDLAGPNRSEVVQQIRLACLSHGVFQVKNHGIPTSLITDMLGVAEEFFKLPKSERKKWYSGNPLKSTSPSMNPSANTEDDIWKDFLWIQCYPMEDFAQGWPSNPSTFRPVVSEYIKYVRDLALNLLRAISESLSLEGNYIEKALGKQAQLMVINYYPPLQEPAFGVPGHKDPNAISILLQDEVPGLQAFHDGKWVPVDPIPDTFTVIIGDQIDVISNGMYKSVLHRALLKPNKERISIPTFYSPSPETVMKPAEVLGDEHHPLIYRSFTYGEYYDSYLIGGVQTEKWVSGLDMVKK